ncbi:MAG: signal recognition particle-docking protein FtsY [Pseudomonadota bacterium]
MLGWFKKKFGKKEEQIAAPDQEQPDQIEPGPAEPALTDDISLEASPATLDETQEPLASTEPLPQTSSFPDLQEKKAGPGKKNSSMFQRLSERLTKTKESLVYRIDTLFLGKKEIDQELLDELEEILITADLGVNTAQELLDEARRKLKRKELSDPQTLKKVLKEKIRSFITESDQPAELVMPDKGPFIIMVVGVNGVGKTTTIGKITHKFANAGQSVLLVAADTFRAAAVAQLKIWGERNNVQVVSQHEGADPSAVVYDAMDIALSKNYDVVIVDTAGRLHTQVNLMEELKKIKRVIGKKIPAAPHEVMLILDATTGQNAISQAKLFNATVDITGLTLTKLDGTAKGGIVVNICRELKIPIRFIGIGEQLEDLRDFDPNEFVEALFQEKESR